MNGIAWPPPFASDMVAAPAGESSARAWLPSKDQLEWSHKALQVLFLLLALLGLMLLLGSAGPRAVLRGAARKNAVA